MQYADMNLNEEGMSNYLLRFSARGLATWLGAFFLMAMVIQLTYGASPLVVAVSGVSCAVGLYAFAVMGTYNAGSWLVFFYVLGNVMVAVYAKTLLGQPVDSHLEGPEDAYTVVMVGSISISLALIVAKFIVVGRPLFKPLSDPSRLGFLSWGCFGLGGFFWFLNRLFQDPTGSGFGGVAVFRDLLLMAVIARTASLLELSGDRRSFDWKLGVILAASVLMGLVDNQKTQAALPVVSYFATVLFYRRGISLKHAAVLGVGCLVFVLFVAPMVHAYRALGEQQMPIGQRISLLERGFESAVIDGDFAHYDVLAKSQFEGGYYNYFGGIRGQMLIGRYASVQQVDPVVASINRTGTLGGSVIWPAFTRLLPQFLYPQKSKYIEAYLILVRLGLINPQGGKYPTVPLVGQAYAGYGISGLLWLPFLVFVVFILALKKLGWNLYRNVYGIFFLCDFVIVYSNQGDLNQYAGSVLRDFPLLALSFWFLLCVYTLKFKLPLARPPRLGSVR